MKGLTSFFFGGGERGGGDQGVLLVYCAQAKLRFVEGMCLKRSEERGGLGGGTVFPRYIGILISTDWRVR